VGAPPGLTQGTLLVSLVSVRQSYLRLLALYNRVIQFATSGIDKSLGELMKAHTSLVMPFIAEYEGLAKGFVAGLHCSADMHQRLTSVTFPKLHGAVHLVDSIVQVGHPWGFNTGTRTASGWCETGSALLAESVVSCVTAGAWEMVLQRLKGCFGRTTKGKKTVHIELALALRNIEKWTTQVGGR